MSKNKEIRYGTEVLSADDRKTLLLLSDDMRMQSGVATMSMELVLGTCHRYNYIQLGAAINHPEKGKEIDLSQDIIKRTGVNNPIVKVIPWDNYGDANILRQMIMKYKPDGIIPFTDPRYFRWLFEIENEIRRSIPIMYYNIWDNVGTPENNFGTDPSYNKSFYASCDGLFAISKQTYGMNNRVMENTYGDELNIINI